MIPELAKPEEFDAVNALARQVNDLHAQWRPDIYVRHSHPISPELYRELLEQRQLYVLREQQAVVAYATVRYTTVGSPGIIPRKILVLDQLCVDEACRHQGLGRKMFGALKELAREQGCTDLQLACDLNNKAAIDFYEGLGMEVKCLQYRLKL